MKPEAPLKSKRRLTRKLFLIAFGAALALATILSVRPAIEVRWVTESELDVTGYNLFRKEPAAGPFRQVNRSILPPAADPFLGGEHTFLDEDVRLGRTYYYQLETVDRAGNRSRSGTIILRPRLRLTWPHTGESGR